MTPQSLGYNTYVSHVINPVGSVTAGANEILIVEYSMSIYTGVGSPGSVTMFIDGVNAAGIATSDFPVAASSNPNVASASGTLIIPPGKTFTRSTAGWSRLYVSITRWSK